MTSSNERRREDYDNGEGGVWGCEEMRRSDIFRVDPGKCGAMSVSMRNNTSIWCFREHSKKSEASTSGVGLESTKWTTRVQKSGWEQRTSRQNEQTAAMEYGNRVGDFRFGSSGIGGWIRALADCPKPSGPSMSIHGGIILFLVESGWCCHVQTWRWWKGIQAGDL